MKRWIPALLLLLFLLGACSRPPAATQAPQIDAPSEVPIESPSSLPSETPGDIGQVEPQASASSAEDELVVQPTATIDPNLRASDPTNVNLASGKPTLVEFFAFW